MIIVLLSIGTVGEIDSNGHNFVPGTYAQVLQQSNKNYSDIVKTSKLQSECGDLAAKSVIAGIDYPPGPAARATSALGGLQIPTLILGGIVKYNDPVWYTLGGSNNHTNQTGGGSPTNSSATKYYRLSSSVPSYVLYTGEIVKLSFEDGSIGTKPLHTNIYLEGMDLQHPVSSQFVTWQFKEDTTSKNVFVVPSVYPNHCYLLKINTDFSRSNSNGSNEIITTDYMDLVEVEEP